MTTSRPWDDKTTTYSINNNDTADAKPASAKVCFNNVTTAFYV